MHGHRHVTWTAPEGALSVLSAQRADPNKVYEITILFFYTPQFADDFHDRAHMEDEIEKSVGLLNLALDNSHVNAHFRVVGIERHPAMLAPAVSLGGLDSQRPARQEPPRRAGS